MKSMSRPNKVKIIITTILKSILTRFICAEIIGYAEFLGMDLKEDADLLYIAEEGLKAPVPEPWKAFSNENDEIYYTNTITG